MMQLIDSRAVNWIILESGQLEDSGNTFRIWVSNVQQLSAFRKVITDWFPQISCLCDSTVWWYLRHNLGLSSTAGLDWRWTRPAAIPTDFCSINRAPSVKGPDCLWSPEDEPLVIFLQRHLEVRLCVVVSPQWRQQVEVWSHSLQTERRSPLRSP